MCYGENAFPFNSSIFWIGMRIFIISVVILMVILILTDCFYINFEVMSIMFGTRNKVDNRMFEHGGHQNTITK